MKALALYTSIGGSEPEDYIAQCAPLVKRIAYHLLARLPASVQVDDLIQSGMIGLLEATRRYDPHQGVAFTTFAEPRIRGAMLDEIRRGDWTPRSVHRKGRQISAAIRAVESTQGHEARDADVASHMGVTLTEYHKALGDLRGQKLLSLDEYDAEGTSEVEQVPSPLDGPSALIDREDFMKQLAGVIQGLPERERLVMSLYYEEELHLKEIGAVLGVSESRVSQLHSQAVARIRARLTGTVKRKSRHSP